MNYSQDIYQRVTDSIIKDMEKGLLPWVRPWSADHAGNNLGSTGMPMNHISKRTYSGVNVLILWGAAWGMGYASQRWLTFNQCKALGGSVRRGERATAIVHFNLIGPSPSRA